MAVPSRIPIHVRYRIIKLRRLGLFYTVIAKIISEEGYAIRAESVRNFFRRYVTRKSVTDQKPPGIIQFFCAFYGAS